MRKHYLLLLLAQLFFTACSTVKYLPENESTVYSEKTEFSSVETTNTKDTVVDIPDSSEKMSILSLFDSSYKELDQEQLTCMAEVMYFEARGEGREGMLAIGHVVMNRTTDPRFPDSVCKVTKQGKHVNGKPVRNKCQFSWYCDGLPDVIKDNETYLIALELAISVLTGQSTNPVGKSLYFHAVYVRPRWARIFLRLRKVGKHIFYV